MLININHTNYVYTMETNYGNYVRERYNCRNLFLKVQSNDELRKSPDKPFHVLIAL